MHVRFACNTFHTLFITMWVCRHRKRLADLIGALHNVSENATRAQSAWMVQHAIDISTATTMAAPQYSSSCNSFASRGIHTTPSTRTVDQQSLPFRLTPQSWHPYLHLMRLDKPIGTWLLAWPCMWSIALASPPCHLPDAHTMALFGIGSILLRGAGCTINDLWDRDLDRRVARTKTRPLAAGTVSVPGALALLGAQLAAGLGVLVQLNTPSIALGASSLVLVATYPLMKRITYWVRQKERGQQHKSVRMCPTSVSCTSSSHYQPQAVLGLTFNWGALLGWCAVRGSIDPVIVLPLYAGGVAWTLVYDTIYAHQDKRDDAAIGVKSTALLFGDRTKLICGGFATAAVLGIGTAGACAGLSAPFFVGMGGAAGHLAWQLRSVDLGSPQSCMDTFVSNQWFGALVFASIVAGKVMCV